VTPGDFAQFAVDIELDMLGSNCGIGPAELLDSTQGIVDSGIEWNQKVTAVFPNIRMAPFIFMAVLN